MNLIDCNSCGIVLNKDKLVFPDPEDPDGCSGSINTDVCVWHEREYYVTLPCPACKTKYAILGDQV